jgi:hypothetical protein
MRFDDERELKTVLFKHWFDFRAEKRWDEILPRCETFSRSDKEGTWGYRIVNHRLHRQLRIPGAGSGGGEGLADLVETYWRQTLKNDEMDPQHPPTLFINVIELKNRPLIMADVEQVVRYMKALESGLRDLGVGADDHTAFRSHEMDVYVYGALVGPGVTPEVGAFKNIVTAIWPEYTNDPLRIGVFSLDPVNGLMIDRFDGNEWLDDETERSSVIEHVVGKDQFFDALLKAKHRRFGEEDEEDDARASKTDGSETDSNETDGNATANDDTLEAPENNDYL